MPAGLRRTLWVLPVAGAVAFWALWRFDGSKAPAVVAEAPPEVPAAVAPETIARPYAAGAPEEVVAEAPVPALGAFELRQLCGRPWEAAFTDECEAALERRYRDRVPDLKPLDRQFRPVMLGEPVTWAEVFDDPAGDLAAAREALGRPECLVPKGQLRLDLREDCAADEIAKLAILRAECAVSIHRHYSLESRQRRWDTGLADAHRAADQAEYHRRLERMDDDWFGMMWRLGKCRALPEGALGALGPFRRPLGWWILGHEQVELMLTAARLGSDWALSSVLWWPLNVSNPGDEELNTSEDVINEVGGERPVLAELLRMRRAQGAEQIAHALVALQLGDALGVPVQAEGVLRIIGLIDLDEERAAWPLAARRLIRLGWTLVVADPAGGEPRRFEAPEQVLGDEPWLDWLGEGRFQMVAAPVPTPP